MTILLIYVQYVENAAEKTVYVTLGSAWFWLLHFRKKNKDIVALYFSTMFDIARNTISFDPLCFERVKMFNITEIKSEILLELK